MTPLQTALTRRARQQELTRNLRSEARSLWAAVDRGSIRDSWSANVNRLVILLAAIQQIGAAEADEYVASALAAQALDADADAQVRPEGYAGFASDGRPLDSLIYQAVPATLAAIQAGATQAQAMATGWATLDMILSTQVADSFRSSASVAMETRPTVTKYVRMLVPPSCSRCAILAGSYSRQTAFRRHPRCDCVAIPATEATSTDLVSDARVDPKDYFNSLSKVEQDRVFTAAGAQAIRDGADIGRVVNARRKAAGLTQAQVLGSRRSLVRDTQGRFTTSELRGRGVRLLPESIYELAGDDRDLALRMLRQHGYIY
jgi:hypothetical protein